MGVILEVCVDTAAGLAEAVAGGADRVELCAALALGGLTPSAGLMELAARCGIPVMVMIRPRAGDFIWTETELRVMETDIATARTAGLAGVVLGALAPDRRLDQAALARLTRAAAGMDLTLHRCFDLVPDMGVALEEAVALGFRRILTSGGAETAAQGAKRIQSLVRQAAERISIMPGSGVKPSNAVALMGLGVSELHGSCSVGVPGTRAGAALGFGWLFERQTHAALVRAMKRAMEAAI